MDTGSILPPVKNKEYRQGNAGEPSEVIPFQRFAEIGDGEDRENGECDHFLNGFELRGGEFVGPDAVRGHLETVFKESDAPTNHNHLPQGDAAELQVAVPGKSHEDVGNRQQNYGSHLDLSPFGDMTPNYDGSLA